MDRPTNPVGRVVFVYRVANPTENSFIEFGANGKVVATEGKLVQARANFAKPGFYTFDDEVVEIATSVSPSALGELEITAVMKEFCDWGKLRVKELTRGTFWLDPGTFNTPHEVGNYVRIIEEHQGPKIGCVEEIVWSYSWIGGRQLEHFGQREIRSGCGEYLISFVEPINKISREEK